MAGAGLCRDNKLLSLQRPSKESATHHYQRGRGLHGQREVKKSGPYDLLILDEPGTDWGQNVVEVVMEHHYAEEGTDS